MGLEEEGGREGIPNSGSHCNKLIDKLVNPKFLHFEREERS